MALMAVPQARVSFPATPGDTPQSQPPASRSLPLRNLQPSAFPSKLTVGPGRLAASIATVQPTMSSSGSMISSSHPAAPGTRSASPLASRWRELAGEHDWSGLLDPMEPLLRTELIRYGEMAQACYDAFDYDPFSKYCGSCKYPRRRFFESLGMGGEGYAVTRYLYATSNLRLPNFLKRSRCPKTWTETGNWIGYVAVSTDAETSRIGRRNIVVAWRGTVTKLEWLADLSDILKPVASEGIPCPDPRVMVEAGFADLYTDRDPSCRFCHTSAREQVLAEVRRLVRQHTASGEEVSVSLTGHSLGSALATLSAYDIAESGANSASVPVPVTVYSFSGPRVGNVRFKERLEGELGVKVLRVANVHDAVPKVPGVLVNERAPAVLRWVAERVAPWWCYSHVGRELQVDHAASPFLRETKDLGCSHNLEALLHLLDGYHGKGKAFSPATGRDPALVNKACDFLKEEHLVPPCWRQDENKGMVIREGRWVQPEREAVHRDHDPFLLHHHPRFQVHPHPDSPRALFAHN